MDYPIHTSKRNKIKLFKEFQFLDLIPYSIALLMLCGECYIIVSFLKIVHSVK